MVLHEREGVQLILPDIILVNPSITASKFAKQLAFNASSFAQINFPIFQSPLE